MIGGTGPFFRPDGGALEVVATTGGAPARRDGSLDHLLSLPGLARATGRGTGAGRTQGGADRFEAWADEHPSVPTENTERDGWAARWAPGPGAGASGAER